MSRKEEIIQATIKVLQRNDFRDDFSMSSIAKEVNIGKSTIYEYFQNKDDLLRDALFHFIQQNIEQVTIQDDLETFTFEELFKAQVTRLLEASNNSRVMIQAMRPKFMEKLPEEIRMEIKVVMDGVRENLRQRFTKFFEKGVFEGVLTNKLTPLDGYVFTSLIVGAIITIGDPNQTLSIQQVVDKLYDTIVILGS